MYRLCYLLSLKSLCIVLPYGAYILLLLYIEPKRLNFEVAHFYRHSVFLVYG
jgi:hypothetical protein